MKPVNYVIPTYNQPKLLRQAVEAAWQSDYANLHITVIDLSTAQYADEVLRDCWKTPTILTMPTNIGLSGAWNLGFALYDDYVVTANDDVFIETDTITELVNAAENSSEGLFFGAHDAFSLFLLKRHTFLEVGAFDTVFWPIYWDDVDYDHRLRQLGYIPQVVTSARLTHVGSASLKSIDAVGEALHHRQFRRNQAYYEAKWGGRHLHETFPTPFNGARPIVPPREK